MNVLSAHQRVVLEFDVGSEVSEPDFIRILPDGSTEVSPGGSGYRIPTGQVLIITDVDWHYEHPDGAAAAGRIQLLSLFIENLADSSQRKQAFESIITLSSQGKGGISEASATGFAVSWRAKICPVVTPDPDGLQKLILRGYLIEEPLSGEPFFNMEILSVEENSGRVNIETTGAKYELTRNGMRLIRRIDPSTNSVNPKAVGQLNFTRDIGPLSVESANKRFCIVQSDILTFAFKCDSLFFITNKSGDAFEYTHRNLIADVPWFKEEGVEVSSEKGPKHARMWTDGYGGSLHAHAKGDVTSVNTTDDITTITLHDPSPMDPVEDEGVLDPITLDDPFDEPNPIHPQMAHMVFPPRFFDFEALYGETAKPFIWFFYGVKNAEEQLRETIELARDPNSILKQNPFGYIALFNGLYTGAEIHTDWPSDNARAYPVPVTVPFLHETFPILGYEFKDDGVVRESIRELHGLGFKVLAYMHFSHYGYDEEPEAFATQVPELTLQWMHYFREEYNFDGYYFDHAGYGKYYEDNWYKTYSFIQRVRKDIGDSGYIYHHNSIDVWGVYSGLRAIMIDTYCNAQLAGEITNEDLDDSADVDYPDEKHMRFFSSGYGLSQTIGSHKRLSNMRLALSKAEKNRLMGENLNCMERNDQVYETIEREVYEGQIFLEAYNARKDSYRSGAFNPDVQWPPEWFRRITDVDVSTISENSVVITWTTDEMTDSVVAYTSNEVWWETGNPEWPNGPNGEVKDETSTIDHSITLEGLTPETMYEYRIRSSNNRPGLDERIWGHVGSFTL